MVEKVEEAPRVTNDDEETDMFIQFKNGPHIGVQFTVMGFNGDLGEKRKTLEKKALSVMRRKSVSYYGKENLSLSMIKGNTGEFSAAIAEWESDGKKGDPSDYMRKDFSDKAIRMIIEFLEHKFHMYNNAQDLKAAQRIHGLFEDYQNQKARATKKAG